MQGDLDNLLEKCPPCFKAALPVLFPDRRGDYLVVEGEDIARVIEARRKFDELEDRLGFGSIQPVDVVDQDDDPFATLCEYVLDTRLKLVQFNGR